MTGSFAEVLDDTSVVRPEDITRVILCSGKVVWDAIAERDKRGAKYAIVRIEQLYPFPIEQIKQILAKYENAKELVWLQEEPENMGPRYFVDDRIWMLKEQGYSLRHVARVESGSPATGSKTIHDQELDDLMAQTFANG